MNITFKKLRYKNLLSTGNVFTEIDLNKCSTTLLAGKNGNGKSSIIDAIVFCLYGKPHRKINKPQLINTINQKDLLVELEFTSGKKNYIIKRGMKPNIFEIWCNDILLNQDAAIKDYQEHLEQNILKLNFKSFCQIVVIGSSTYIPFMDLTPASRREIIEDLLDIQIFSTMNVLLKEEISDSKTKIDEIKTKIEILKNKINSAKENADTIKELKEIEIKKIKDKISLTISSIERNNSFIEDIEIKINDQISKIADKSSIKTKFEKIKSLKNELKQKTNTYSEELSFYHDNDNCPICKQGIEHNFKKNIINEKEIKIEEINNSFITLDNKLLEYENRLEEISLIEDEISKYNLKINEYRSEIRIYKNTLSNSKDELEEYEKDIIEIDSSKIDDYNQQLIEYNTLQSDLLSEREILGIASTILKDNGIKAKILKQYIPIMNKLINKYLSIFELFVDFNLDENFNEIIKSRFRDIFSYSSFSEGEKLRINLSILFTWRTIAKMRNSVSTNLLILDETLDGALDATGVDSLLQTLKHMNKDDNIFVVSHRGEQFAEKFDHVIEFVKEKNFSKIKEVI